MVALELVLWLGRGERGGEGGERKGGVGGICWRGGLFMWGGHTHGAGKYMLINVCVIVGVWVVFVWPVFSIYGLYHTRSDRRYIYAMAAIHCTGVL